jgi:hypothetical protein
VIFNEPASTNYFITTDNSLLTVNLLTPNEDSLCAGYFVLTLALKVQLYRLRVVGYHFKVWVDSGLVIAGELSVQK